MFQSAIVMMTDICQRLFQMLADFSQGIALKEKQRQGLTLLFTQCFKRPAQYRLALAYLGFIFHVRGCPHLLSHLFNAAAVIEAAHLKIFTAIKSTVIGSLHQPGTRRAPVRIKELALAVDLKED